MNKKIRDILDHVPPNYYQVGIKNNFLQRVWHMGKLNAVLDLSGKNYTNILDVGCASGWFLHQISRKYPKAKCTGLDLHKDAIVYGKKYYKNLNLIHSDAHKLPFGDHSFDLIICTEVLEHVLNPSNVIKEIKRVLAKDGIAIIEMDSGNILFKIVWYWWNNLRTSVWKEAHLHKFNTKKLEDIIIKNGLLIKKKKTFNFTMAVAFKLKLRLDK